MSLRITMATGSLSRRAGGVFQAVSQLSIALHMRGHKVRVIGLRDPGMEKDLSAWAPIEPIVLDKYGPPRLGLADGIGSHLTDSDIVHQHRIWQQILLIGGPARFGKGLREAAEIAFAVHKPQVSLSLFDKLVLARIEKSAIAQVS